LTRAIGEAVKIVAETVEESERQLMDLMVRNVMVL